MHKFQPFDYVRCIHGSKNETSHPLYNETLMDFEEEGVVIRFMGWSKFSMEEVYEVQVVGENLYAYVRESGLEEIEPIEELLSLKEEMKVKIVAANLRKEIENESIL